MKLFSSPVGFFGKLPAYPDFVRKNAGGALARALDDWVHEGVAQMNVQGGEDWRTRFDAGVGKNFLYHTDDPSKILIGIYVPSRDMGGRRYPFSLFANAASGRNGQLVHLLPEAYAVFLQAAGRLLANLDHAAGELRSGKVSGLATVLPQNLYEFDRRFQRYLELKKMSDFWSETIGSFTDPAKYLLMRNLLSALTPLRGKDIRKFELCLALPLSKQPAEQGFQIAIYLALCRRILGQPVNSIVAFWDMRQVGGRVRLYLFFRPPGPRYLPFLFNPDSAGDSIWDMATIGADKIDEMKGKLPQEIVALLDNADLSVDAFLSKLAD